ncbi:hypothetical protein SGPA1_22021 [Streptomyces misionensis JCM 4497]
MARRPGAVRPTRRRPAPLGRPGCGAPLLLLRRHALTSAAGPGARPALGQLAGGVLDPQQRPLDTGAPPGLRAVVPALGSGADVGREGPQVLLQPLPPGPAPDATPALAPHRAAGRPAHGRLSGQGRDRGGAGRWGHA